MQAPPMNGAGNLHVGHVAMIWPIYFSMGRCMNGDGPIASLASFSNSRTLEAGVTYFRSPLASNKYRDFFSEYSEISDFIACFSVIFKNIIVRS